MSMPPNEPKYVIRRDYERYTILIRDEHGAYRTLLTLEGRYNWKDAAEAIEGALISADPTILPEPHDGSTPKTV